MSVIFVLSICLSHSSFSSVFLFSPLTFCLPAILSLTFFCLFTSTSTCLSPIRSHLHSFITSLCQAHSVSTLPLLPVLSLGFLSSMSNCLGTSTHHILQPSEPSSIHLHKSDKKKSIKEPCDMRNS